jgi:hypothetical protein
VVKLITSQCNFQIRPIVSETGQYPRSLYGRLQNSERLANALPRPNYSRSLSQPIVILDDDKEFLRLTTLGDVGDFIKRLPKDRQHFDAWQVVNQRLDAAAAGGSIEDLLIALQMAFRLEHIAYRSA